MDTMSTFEATVQKSILKLLPVYCRVDRNGTGASGPRGDCKRDFVNFRGKHYASRARGAAVRVWQFTLPRSKYYSYFELYSMTKSEFWFSMIPPSYRSRNVPSSVLLNSTVFFHISVSTRSKNRFLSRFRLGTFFSSRFCLENQRSFPACTLREVGE
jgi:hypothetical protein